MNKEKLINESIDYILQHLGENTSIKDVAEHFHFSEFYFSRVFKAETGESIYAFMKRLKMEQSAIDMKVKKDRPITDIGLDYGYSASNYSSAFRKHYQASPAQFRNSINAECIANPFQPGKIEVFSRYKDYADKIQIREIPDMQVIYQRIIGDYHELREKWLQFMDKYKTCLEADSLMIERFYDDPAIASLHRCICDLCVTVDRTCGLENMTILRGGKFAVYRFSGTVTDIFCSLQGVFSVWLPESGYIMDERYGLNIYREVNFESGYVVMDLCIPVK